MDTVEVLRVLVRNMKALAAVSIRQYDTALYSLSCYRNALDLGFQAWSKKQPGRFASEGEYEVGDVVGAVVFGADQGLCGRVNS